MGKTVFVSCGQFTGVIVGVALEVPVEGLLDS
jgi:hypothetical protein